MHDCCKTVFPAKSYAPALRAWQHPATQLEVKHLWARHRELKTLHLYHKALRLRSRETGLLAYAVAAFRRHAAFQKCQQALCRRGKERRKAIIQDVLQEAERAASVGDMRALYQQVRRLAPKAPRERIQIRGPDDAILSPEQEFPTIHAYFTQLYQQGPVN